MKKFSVKSESQIKNVLNVPKYTWVTLLYSKGYPFKTYFLNTVKMPTFINLFYIALLVIW